jgi:hypothetical protein
MKKIKSSSAVFEKNHFSITKKNKIVTVDYSEIEKIIYIKNSFWNWITGRSHAVIPGRIHVFLKSDNGNNRYSLKISNKVFSMLPHNLISKLPEKYKKY